MKKEYKHIFEPFTVRRMTMKNRIMMTPMGTNYGESSGEMSASTSVVLPEFLRPMKAMQLSRRVFLMRVLFCRSG